MSSMLWEARCSRQSIPSRVIPPHRPPPARVAFRRRSPKAFDPSLGELIRNLIEFTLDNEREKRKLRAHEDRRQPGIGAALQANVSQFAVASHVFDKRRTNLGVGQESPLPSSVVGSKIARPTTRTSLTHHPLWLAPLAVAPVSSVALTPDRSPNSERRARRGSEGIHHLN